MKLKTQKVISGPVRYRDVKVGVDARRVRIRVGELQVTFTLGQWAALTALVKAKATAAACRKLAKVSQL